MALTMLVNGKVVEGVTDMAGVTAIMPTLGVLDRVRVIVNGRQHAVTPVGKYVVGKGLKVTGYELLAL